MRLIEGCYILLIASMMNSSAFVSAQDRSSQRAENTPFESRGDQSGAGGNDADDLANKLANPIADLISVPFQHNFDFGLGPEDHGWQYKLNVQPVIPMKLTDDWLVISRTIIPLIYQEDALPVQIPGEEDQFGFGDTLQSWFFSPKDSGVKGFFWGLGPAMLVPTGTDDFLTGEQLGLGPTGVLLQQTGKWTVGILANHIWSVLGPDDAPDISQTFLQPFLAYNLGKGLTINANLESTYDWLADRWAVPLNAGFTKVTKIGDQAVSFGLQGRYYFDSPDNGADWGLRFTSTLLFPEK